jgi:hypothetical protein
MQTNNFQPKLEALVSRYRGTQANPTPGEIEELYTEGCAELLLMEAEFLRLKRRYTAAAADSKDDPIAAREAAELQQLRDQTADELDALRSLVRLLRTAVDWASASARDERAA